MKWYPPVQYSLGEEVVESSPEEKDLGELVDKRLDMIQQRTPTSPRASRILGDIKSSVASRSGEVIPPVCSALEPTWSAVLSSEAFSTEKTDLFKCIHTGATEMILSNKEKLREGGLFCLEKKTLWRL